MYHVCTLYTRKPIYMEVQYFAQACLLTAVAGRYDGVIRPTTDKLMYHGRW